MEKEFKKIIGESKTSLKKMEKYLEAKSEDFTEEVNVFWHDLKKQLSHIDEKLQETYDHFEDQAELKGHLGLMEARDRVEKIQETTREFTDKIANNAQEKLDIAALRVHLAKMESEDLWEEKQKELLHIYDDARDEAQKAAAKAAKELNNMILKLTEII
ncbi:hypothetical protein MN086_06480 [Sulfurovum sp. XGS-02]|uniref:hypothetical protein n=1 Tax=Sulfurovum sp. XGS-02 TaxID=2925411 RepID=UPI0020475D62|nr:hypothetical protein [Sulfurovum sp. XGS-02]UPT76697.1 hypothetical protein MN086_06480 [Sulfurovum sp. XGS-02]